MPIPIDNEIGPGRRVRIVQQIPQRDDVWTTEIEGEVVSFQQAKTGSWFAHAKDDRLWLDRLELRLDDGEVTIVNLDQFSHVELIDSGRTHAAGSATSDTPPESAAVD